MVMLGQSVLVLEGVFYKKSARSSGATRIAKTVAPCTEINTQQYILLPLKRAIQNNKISAECGKGEKFRKAFDLVDQHKHFRGAAIGTAGAMGTGMNQLLSHIANIVTADTREGKEGGDSARGHVITQLRQFRFKLHS